MSERETIVVAGRECHFHDFGGHYRITDKKRIGSGGEFLRGDATWGLLHFGVEPKQWPTREAAVAFALSRSQDERDYTTPPLKIVGAGKVLVTDQQFAREGDRIATKSEPMGATPPAPAGERLAELAELEGLRKVQSKQAKKIRNLKESVRQKEKALARRTEKLNELFARIRAINGDDDQFRKLIAEKDQRIKSLVERLDPRREHREKLIDEIFGPNHPSPEPAPAGELPTSEISSEQLLSDVQWLLSEAQRLQFSTGTDDPPPLGQHIDPKWTAIRRIASGQTVGISRRYLEAIVRDLSKLTLTAASEERPAHPDEPRITGFGIDPKTSDLRHITFACNGKNVAAWRTGTGWKAEWEPLSPAPPAGDQQGEQSAGIQATEVSVPPPGDAQPVARSPVDPPAAVELPTGEGYWTRFYDNDPASGAPAYWSITVRVSPNQHGLRFSGFEGVRVAHGNVGSLPGGGWSQLRPASDELEVQWDAPIPNGEAIKSSIKTVGEALEIERLTARLVESETIRKNLGRICEVNEAFHWRLADLFDEGVRGVSPLHFVEKNIVALKEKATAVETRVRELEAIIAADCRDWAEFDDMLDAMGAPKGDDYSRPATIERLEWVKAERDKLRADVEFSVRLMTMDGDGNLPESNEALIKLLNDSIENMRQAMDEYAEAAKGK